MTQQVWPVEIKLVPEDGAFFVFATDPRPEAKEILEMLKVIYEHGIQYLDLTIYGKNASCAFWGEDFLCPFETTISKTLCISGGKFYRVNDGDPDDLEEFEMISFQFLAELHQALKSFTANLPQLS